VARENSSDDSVVGKPSHSLETTLSTALSALVIVQAMDFFNCQNSNQTASQQHDITQPKMQPANPESFMGAARHEAN
jgi:hypothetical protein